MGIGSRPGGAVLLGLALASLGGPLALSALYAPGVAGPAFPSLGLATLLGGAAFCVPLAVWWRYAGDVSSAGGLTAFVYAAAGRRAALVQGAIWTVAYFLYLPYTVTYLAYDLLPVVFPGIGPYRFVVQLALPLAATALVLAPLAGLLALVGAVAVAQLGLLLALGAVELRHVGAPASSFAVHESPHAFARATAGMSLLLVCGSLPFFLGGEARGGGRAIRAAVAGAVALAVPYAAFAAFPLAAVPAGLRNAEIPGYAIASAYAGRGFGVAVGLGVVASDATLLLLEFVALSRLLHYATRRPVRRTTLWIAVPFAAAAAVGLADPHGFYERTITPSLWALWLSQLLAVAVYPLYRRRRERLSGLDVVLAAGAGALMGWALYLVASGQAGG